MQAGATDEGRGYLGWRHHVTMTTLAYGFLLL